MRRMPGILTKPFLVSLIGLLAVPVACTSATRTTTTLTAEEVVAKTIEVSSSLATYSMDMSITGSIDGTQTANNQIQTIAATTTGSGKGESDVKKSASRMSLRIEVNVQAPAKQSVQQNIETYVQGGFVYGGIQQSSGVMQWTKTKALGTDGGLPDAATLNDAIELLKGAPVEKLAEEVVAGKPAYVIKVTPDVGKLLGILMKGNALVPKGGLDAAKVTGDMVKSSSVKMWVSKDSFRVLKEEAQMTAVLDSRAMGLPATSGTFTLNFDVSVQELFDYDAIVSITVPAEALSAPER